MIFELLTDKECELYNQDIFLCFKDNPLFFDIFNPNTIKNKEDAKYFVKSFIDSDECLVFGVFDDNKKILYGLVILDEVRMGLRNSAKCHILLTKELWGRQAFDICEKIIQKTIIDVFYCEIPAYAYKAIGLVKKLGFKKTGYIPKIIPYVTINKSNVMHDILIYTLNKPEPVITCEVINEED